MCEAADALVVKISAVCTSALACAGGSPSASIAALASTPSTSCATKPMANNSMNSMLINRPCGCGRRVVPALQRISLEMSRHDEVPIRYPPHPEEGASTYASEKRHRCIAPVSKDGRPPRFETPRTRLQYLGRSEIAAPHHEGRERPGMQEMIAV